MSRKGFTPTVLGIMMFVSTVTFSQTVDISEAFGETLNISANMEVLEDPSGVLGLSDLDNLDFRQNGKDEFVFPFTNSVFWVRLNLVNERSDNSDWVLHWDNPVLEELSFYSLDAETGQIRGEEHYNMAEEKDTRLYSQEPVFHFGLPKGRGRTIYFRLKSRRGHFGFLRAYSLSGFKKSEIGDHDTQALVNGMLIFRLLLIGILSFSIISDKLFRSYSAIIFMKTIGFWSLGNVTGPLFSDDPEVIARINHIFYTIMPLCLLLFALKTLALDQVKRWIGRLGYAILIGAFVLIMISTYDYQWYWVKASMSFSVISGAYALALYGYFGYKKLNIHKYYSIPLLLGLVSNLLIMVRVLTHFSFNGIFALAFAFFVAEILVFIIFLGKIFRQTERRKFEAEQALLTEADQNRRLQELDDLKTSFFTDISHEIRTPLTLMYGPAQELLKKYPDEKMTGLLADNLSKLRGLVDELLDIQKLEAGKMTPVIIKGDVGSQLRLLISSFDSLAESKGVSLSLKQSHDHFKGCYDEQMLSKIVNNLLSNAIKFTPKGGEIRCLVDFNEKSQQLVFTVSNTGSRISGDQLLRVFDRFYQVEQTGHSGSGVGLALVRELVTLLKGDIKVSSNDLETSFSLELPLNAGLWPTQEINETEISDEISLETANKETPATETTHREGRELLLLVEDNDDMRSYIRTLLAAEYNLIEAENGKEGFKLAKKEVPDIIICDAMMPVMDGYEFSKRIKSTLQTSHIPIVMLTAKTSRASRIESYEQGVDNYLTKPFDTDELKTVLNALRANRKKLREIYAKEVIDLKPEEIKVSSREKQFLDGLKQCLEANYRESGLTVTDLANALRVSDTQLRRKLKSISGYSPNEYLRKFRLDKAAQLLSSQARSVSEVAYDVGFENLSYFSKAFFNEYNCLPSEYGIKKVG
ncbi:MAG: response regulator [Roseivirga sp.]|nr:response regulator [Roseivirga sp.]